MSKTITDAVRDKYAAVAASDLSGTHSGVHAVAEAFGYSAEELASIPAQANMGLSCGNPTATANLRPGEVVVDLGSGGGLDVFLASKKVGPTGRAIGIDMTPEMVARATTNAQRQGFSNVEFHLSTINQMPLDSDSADCVISNCVINLVPDKAAVFREIFRVLKPGGRVAISDIALKKQLPPEVGNDLMAYIGCVAGAIPVEEYESGLKAAGFSTVQIVDTKKDLNAYAKVEGQAACCSPAMDEATSSCCTPQAQGTASVHGGLSHLTAKYDINEFAASVQVYAVKS
ncbi:Erythromycin 3''-O-methyltransferase [Gemmata obscuriglobus]|uniref:Arsenite methyltransferase n=1 Tax=Gemmata obscuriglobus TaxID=114 RepID=A0A2Z3HBU8_9BACT|nr:arsenite methyltransferase [Gemmata obscuriglobus]AWM39134.1 methyltransferase domain-containing protein [Gemmata obscuriglobus]QEG27821.1 Erythromycin 3''-O-methyltransferase [Gemmata obscuriglobus]VTS05168.1 sam-dependent methyltransferase : Methyltransferase type 11 OS=Planctomyces brasiliensis (strain ATCC 49424 / DSM 5305 / JCM 21570 / NBRC 103401 / IFAM 1448) GN=Plabr_2993 PE=4 SV=1: Methyltransf_31 [Gemmata obscuriglobus UQM 2246]